ncbi:MAG: DNA-processing protein DprA [bacterium]
MSHVVGVVGSRSLPSSFSPLVSRVCSALLAGGYRLASGGAMGADSFAISAILQQGCSSQGVIFSPWSSAAGFPASVRPQVARLLSSGGQVIWGPAFPGAPRGQVVSALLGRNRRLVQSASGIVAFLHGSSRGSLYTVRQAVSRGIPVVVFLCGAGASLPPDLASQCLVINKKPACRQAGR